ncbi:MAG: sugar phosphate isomerase/epimerase family protein [Phycisphaerales bacterium]
MTPAFSTVACPEWTLSAVFEHAATFGFGAVELRTFGDASRAFACEPAHTAPEKIREWSGRFGVKVASLGTSCRFDEPIFPPIVGSAISDVDRTVRIACHAVTLAATIECPLVRVFGFEFPSSEGRKSGDARIIERLAKVVDHAHRTGVSVMIENGGSYPTGQSLMPLIRTINSPLLGACLNTASAGAAGESPAGGIASLGSALMAVRVKDLRAGRPCPLGEGDVPVASAMAALRAARFTGPVIFEWDRAWMPDLAHAQAVLPRAARFLHEAAATATAAAHAAA